MDIGSLNRRITIQSQVGGTDDAGQPLDAWAAVATVWANVLGNTGMGAIKDVQGNIGASINQYSFRIRFRADLDSGMRVLYGDDVYDIKEVRLDLEHREWTDLVCETTKGAINNTFGVISGGDAYSPGPGHISGGGA